MVVNTLAPIAYRSKDASYLLLLGSGQRCAIHTLRNGLAEQPRTLVRNEVKFYGAPACALTVDRHFLGVATEARDVRLHPLQRLHLVEEARVEIPVRAVPQGGSSEETK